MITTNTIGNNENFTITYGQYESELKDKLLVAYERIIEMQDVTIESLSKQNEELTLKVQKIIK